MDENKILDQIDLDRWLSRLPVTHLVLLMRIHNGIPFREAARSIGHSPKHGYAILREIRISAIKFFGNTFPLDLLS